MYILCYILSLCLSPNNNNNNNNINNNNTLWGLLFLPWCNFLAPPFFEHARSHAHTQRTHARTPTVNPPPKKQTKKIQNR